MTRKFGEARRSAFLAALRETGNQTIAAERAKVSRSWVQLHRSSDPAFMRAVAEAVEEAKAVLRQAQHERNGGCEPPRGWGFLGGEKLVVKGTGGSALRPFDGLRTQDERKGGRRVQIARARLKQWSPRVEEWFLAALSATCNVKAACAEVGLTAASAYGHRKRWAAFQRRWDEAVETGYSQIEAGLIHAAGNLFSEDGPVETGPISEMTADHAIHLLHMHKHQVHRIGKRPGLRARWPDIEVVRAEILRKVEAIKGADKRRLELDREEWARRRPSTLRRAQDSG